MEVYSVTNLNDTEASLLSVQVANKRIKKGMYGFTGSVEFREENLKIYQVC